MKNLTNYSRVSKYVLQVFRKLDKASQSIKKLYKSIESFKKVLLHYFQILLENLLHLPIASKNFSNLYKT